MKRCIAIHQAPVELRRLLKNHRNVSETSCAEERGVRRSRCRQCIGKDELTTLFRATRFVPEGYVTIGPSARPDFLNNALTALPVKSRRTAAPIVIVGTKRGFFTSLLVLLRSNLFSPGVAPRFARLTPGFPVQPRWGSDNSTFVLVRKRNPNVNHDQRPFKKFSSAHPSGNSKLRRTPKAALQVIPGLSGAKPRGSKGRRR